MMLFLIFSSFFFLALRAEHSRVDINLCNAQSEGSVVLSLQPCAGIQQMCSRTLQASIDTNRLYTVNVSLWVISVSLHWPRCIVEQLLYIQRNIDSYVFPFADRM